MKSASRTMVQQHTVQTRHVQQQHNNMGSARSLIQRCRRCDCHPHLALGRPSDAEHLNTCLPPATHAGFEAQ